MPFSPRDLVLLPIQKAFSLADSNSYSGLIYPKGISSLYISLPTSYAGCNPISFPSRTPLQQAAALEVTLARIYAFYKPQLTRKLAKLSFPPLSILSISSRVHSSRPTLLTFVTNASSLNRAAQVRQRKTPWEMSVHCLLGFLHWKQRVFGTCPKR